ncbi:MAG: hypothetical protein ABIF77_15305 [bacterium]
MKSCFPRITCWSCLLLLTLPLTVFATEFHLEAESFVDFYEVGGDPIASVVGPGCSGGNMLIGLDTATEWTTYEIKPPGLGSYKMMLKCRGDIGVSYQLELEFTQQETRDTQIVTISFQGMGYG